MSPTICESVNDVCIIQIYLDICRKIWDNCFSVKDDILNSDMKMQSQVHQRTFGVY